MGIAYIVIGSVQGLLEQIKPSIDNLPSLYKTNEFYRPHGKRVIQLVEG